MKRALGSVIAICALNGCHVYEPLISHEIKAKAIEKYPAQECVGDVIATPSLKRACLKLIEIEHARAEHQGLNAITANVLIPTAGYVAFRAARQSAAAATGAIAAGGLAGYATVGYLAPDGRIEAYTRGSKAVSCAIGVYRVTAASGGLAATERLRFQLALRDSGTKIDHALKTNPSAPQALTAQIYLQGIQSVVLGGSATGLMDAQLDQFVAQAIEDLNSLLRGTLPNLANLSAQVAALSNAASPTLPAPPLAPKDGGRADNDAFDGQKDAFALDELKTSAEALLKAEQKRVSADFTSCHIAMDALTAQGIYKPFVLGPGNSLNGQTVQLKSGDANSFAISGGLTPYSVVVTGDPVGFKPAAEITMQGAAILKVTMSTQDTAAAHTYRVTLYDSAGGTRWIDAVVPMTSH